MDFVIRLVNSALNLPDRQVRFFEGFKLQKICESILLKQKFVGLAEMTFGLAKLARMASCENDFLCVLSSSGGIQVVQVTVVICKRN